MSYYNKYMMYKQKYAELKTMLGGASTRGNSYQPALKNMLGGATETTSGYSNIYRSDRGGVDQFVEDVIKEFDFWSLMQLESFFQEHPSRFQIVLHDKRYTSRGMVQAEIESNNLEDFRPPNKLFYTHVKKAGKVKDISASQFKTIFTSLISQYDYRLIDVSFV